MNEAISSRNGGIAFQRLQVLHAHVFLVTPLSAGYMPQPGTDQHQGGIAILESVNHAGASSDFPVQAFNDVVGADLRPVFGR